MKYGIGQSVRHVEDQRFLTGKGSYVDDVVLSRQAYGALVLATEAHARIKLIDISAAIASPGVIVVEHVGKVMHPDGVSDRASNVRFRGMSGRPAALGNASRRCNSDIGLISAE